MILTDDNLQELNYDQDQKILDYIDNNYEKWNLTKKVKKELEELLYQRYNIISARCLILDLEKKD